MGVVWAGVDGVGCWEGHSGQDVLVQLRGPAHTLWISLSWMIPCGPGNEAAELGPTFLSGSEGLNGP